MDSVSTHVIMDKDLFEAAHREAKERETTFSAIYRRALRRELKYPSLITEIRDLRQRVDKIEDTLADALAATDASIEDIHDSLADHVDKNFESIRKAVEILDKHVKEGH